MVCRVGKEVGILMNHELTKTTARVQVSVDGLKPLIKELIIEFDSGEETSITLEYERLEYHCTHCYSLSHARRDCPQRLEEDSAWNQIHKTTSEGFIENPNTSRVRPLQVVEKEREQSKERTEPVLHAFRARVDRHGNPYGERVSTKQTRAPPPPPSKRSDNPSQPLGNQKSMQERSQHLLSPPFTHHRQSSYRETSRGRNLFPQRSQGQWRAKQLTGPEEEHTRDTEPANPPPRESLLPANPQTIVAEPGIRTMDEVLEELHETTRQYLNCPDPVEAAARRQRVLQGDALGQTEEVAASIIAAETRRHYFFSQGGGSASNPNTPPPIQAPSINGLPLPGFSSANDLQDTVVINVEERDHGVHPVTREMDVTPKRASGGPAKLKSIVISPVFEPEIAPGSPYELSEQPMEEETLKEVQSKIKKKGRRPIQTRVPGNSPNILRGASSKKRKISQIQNSPARRVDSSKGAVVKVWYAFSGLQKEQIGFLII
ncbi:Uncharacterized protein Rs2_26544 [Raphanus sativus]|nr:Uncharacterized protein Rs2_26544 [Raphanus sativus]